ncbi:hypothetical protein BY458DRAFT_518631 [Sporodiniella umbellata]|nr:hypothetical protein BY458DRAFT_518631 [Sporodiniella umbellata]
MILSPRQWMAFKKTCPRLKGMVHRLDLSGYTTTGLRWTVDKAKTIVQSKDLVRLLDDCDHLKELCAGEELMEPFVSPGLFVSAFRKPLTTLDLTGIFMDLEESVGRLKAYFEDEPSVPLSLENLSFFMNLALSQQEILIPLFDVLTAQGNQLKKLDFGRTTITGALFSHLPSPGALTHLSLTECCYLACCSEMMDYLEKAVNLVELNLGSMSPLCVRCLDRLLNGLGSQLRSLNLANQRGLEPRHIRALPKLSYVSFAYLDHLDPGLFLDYLQAHAPFYVNLEGIFDLHLSLPSSVQVIEITDSPSYPPQWGPWRFKTFGTRTFYTQQDPSYVYSKKILMGDPLLLSPIAIYHAYS